MPEAESAGVNEDVEDTVEAIGILAAQRSGHQSGLLDV